MPLINNELINATSISVVPRFNIKDTIERYIKCTNNKIESFYVCNLDEIYLKYKLWMDKIPRVSPYYAVKCNHDEMVLKFLAKLGVNFDCASRPEIDKILSLNVTADRIIFANPTKLVSHIEYARSHGVAMMTFDSEFEIQKIKMAYPNAKLVMRIRCDARKCNHPLGVKFGCNPEYDAPKLIDICKREKLNLIGISFHVGSECLEPEAYYRAIKKSRILFDYAKTVGYQFNLLNIGGGYPGEDHLLNLFDSIAFEINKAIDEFFCDWPNLKIISEPGKYFVTKAFTLATQIYSKKVQRNPNDSNKINELMYFINDGVYGSFSKLHHDPSLTPIKYIKPTSDNNHTKAAISNIKFTLWGPTCDSADNILFASNTKLPILDIGDWLYFENMGGYSLAVANHFNGFQISDVKYFITGQTVKEIEEFLKITMYGQNRNLLDINRFEISTPIDMKWQRSQC